MTTPENTSVTHAALATNLVVRAAPGVLRKLDVIRIGGSGVVFVQVHNTTTLPADTAVPVWRSGPIVAVAAGAEHTLSFGDDEGLYLDTGCVVCISTTAAAKTIGSAEALFHAIID